MLALWSSLLLCRAWERPSGRSAPVTRDTYERRICWVALALADALFLWMFIARWASRIVQGDRVATASLLTIALIGLLFAKTMAAERYRRGLVRPSPTTGMKRTEGRGLSALIIAD